MESSTAVVATQLADSLYWVFIGILVVNLMQRKHQERAQKKRFATLYLALGVFAFFAAAQAIATFGGSDWMLVPAAAAVAAILYIYRRHTFPFRFTSPQDGRRLTWQEILYDDHHGDGDDDPSSER